ncbi:MAG TPA: hypothetical protein PLX56_11805, partial [bacterium]|nr:hypothetical protein [bacterium]
GVKTVTVAVESANSETRKKILKNISDEQIFNAMKILKKYHLKAKIYLIAGFSGTDPVKEAEDVVLFLEKLDACSLLYDVTLSIAPLSPKPLTPFQDSVFIDKKEYKKYMVTLKKGISHFQKKVKVDFFSYKESEFDYMTGVLKGKEFVKFIIENIKTE